MKIEEPPEETTIPRRLQIGVLRKSHFIIFLENPFEQNGRAIKRFPLWLLCHLTAKTRRFPSPPREGFGFIG